eukprot:TRINITY_DN12344_c0_g1_i1.p1 TRINITY_DN12344_c0_g1~~TRINITY_DN12344_c0_g1_i1.p1  ORF type:complete len:313 (+),score=84.08 TRINITY_DN12344_c0_g1_i1:116-1054(+)
MCIRDRQQGPPKPSDPEELKQWQLKRQKKKMVKFMDDQLKLGLEAFKQRTYTISPSLDWLQDSSKDEFQADWPDLKISFPSSLAALAKGEPMGVYRHNWVSKGVFADVCWGPEALKVLEDSEQVQGSNPTAATSEAVSMELMSRLFGAVLHRTEINMAADMAFGVDYSCEIGGASYGVSVSRSHISRVKNTTCSDSVALRNAEAVAEPTEGPCHICQKVKQVDQFSKKQWKRVRALVQSRGGIGGCCISCTEDRIKQAESEEQSRRVAERQKAPEPSPEELFCPTCQREMPAELFPRSNDCLLYTSPSPRDS